ncbi:MAG TPA: thiamine pyrophosphate-binding protein [Polyangiaceae bacterium]|nr:thiamine pyrophosphate-binding protein [Polyangiaceae bacterium]
MNLALVANECGSEAGVAGSVISLADQLVIDLAEFGITTYFGVPGGAIEPLFNALARQQRAGLVELVPVRSEGAAAFAADGYFRATGRIAVCTTTTGPGITNLLTAAMSAHADRIPMLILTPQVALRKEGRGALQESVDGYDLPRALGSCTRYSSTITHPDQLPHKLSRALARAFAPPTGPVHLNIPSDLLGARPPASVPRLSLMMFAAAPIDIGAVDALIRDVLNASRPVFYIGDDAGPNAHQIYQVARVLGARVVSSPAGKRWLGHLDPVYKGVVGFSGHARALDVLRKADRIVAFGATFDELSTNAYSAFPDVLVYSVDRHLEHAYRLPQVRPVIGDPGRVIEMLLEQARSAVAGEKPRHSSLPRLVAAPNSLVRKSTDVHPSELMHWLSQKLPPDVVVHVDAGNSFSWSTNELVRPRPDTYRVAMGLCTMCWGIGAVIGAAVAHHRRTLCVSGDGAMLMSSLELTVAVERNLPVTYVILNDSSLGMVRHGQRLGGAEPIAHEIAPVRFDQLAAACGAHGIRVATTAELDDIPLTWLADDDAGPCVIDVCIDREAVPPIGNRVAGLAAGVSR